jgi:plasmid rolling circle replication initiator protein Rep
MVIRPLRSVGYALRFIPISDHHRINTIYIKEADISTNDEIHVLFFGQATDIFMIAKMTMRRGNDRSLKAVTAFKK